MTEKCVDLEYSGGNMKWNLSIRQTCQIIKVF